MIKLNKKLIIIINGPAGVGKDTLIEEYSKRTKNSVYNYSSIDYFKEIAKRDFFWDGKKDEQGRKLLSNIKAIASEYNDLPTEITVKKVEQFYDMPYKNDAVMFVHIREKDETDKLIKRLKEKDMPVKTMFIYTSREIEGFKDNKSDEYSSDWRNGLNDYNVLMYNDDLDYAVNEMSNIIDSYM